MHNDIGSSLKTHFEHSKLYIPAREAYQRVFNRTHWHYRQELVRFYSTFISDRDLVFDSGANVGLYSEAFLECGAFVVAVEPNPACLNTLQVRCRPERLQVENVAVGSNATVAQLFLCDDATQHSTLSSEWIHVAKSLPRLARKEWTQATTVQVITLDTLIAKYGQPRFIKIDVEGFEREALSGLTRTAEFLSFEFISEFVDAAIECVRKSCFRPEDRFNILVNIPSEDPPRRLRLELSEWVPAEAIISILDSNGIRSAKTYGDVFVKRGS
jgi:FkbM family methyltransferase